MMNLAIIALMIQDMCYLVHSLITFATIGSINFIHSHFSYHLTIGLSIHRIKYPQYVLDHF